MHWLASHQGLESLVASSATFQTLVGAANATAAKTSIHFGGTDGEPSRPCALISVDGGNVEETTAFSASGSLLLSLEVPATQYSTGTREARFIAFLTDIDSILSDMNTNGRNGTVNWRMVGFESVVPPHLKSDFEGDPEEPYYTASFLIRWT